MVFAISACSNNSSNHQSENSIHQTGALSNPTDEDDSYELYNYAIGGMSGGPLLFQYEDSMTLETYFGVAGIVAYTNILDNHGYAVKITNATIAALRSTKNYE